MKRKEERKRKRSEEKKKKKGKEEEKKKKRKKSKRGKEEDVSQKGKKSTPVNIETPHLNNKYIRTMGVFFGCNLCPIQTTTDDWSANDDASHTS